MALRLELRRGSVESSGVVKSACQVSAKISLAVQVWLRDGGFGSLVLISATVLAMDVNGAIVCGCCGGVWLAHEV